MANAKKKKLGPGRHLSTMKRHRQDVKRTQLNKPALSSVRTAIKKLLQAVEGADRNTAEKLFVKTQSLIDKAVKRGIIHSRTGHRHIARLHRKVGSLAS